MIEGNSKFKQIKSLFHQARSSIKLRLREAQINNNIKQEIFNKSVKAQVKGHGRFYSTDKLIQTNQVNLGINLVQAQGIRLLTTS